MKKKMVARFLGFCPCCAKDFKIQEGVLVHHGYERPGDGRIHGDCFAVGMTPHETSPDTAKKYLAILRMHEAAAVAYLETLASQTTVTLKKQQYDAATYQYVMVPYRVVKAEVSEHKWAEVMERVTAQAESELRQVRSECNRVQLLVDTWEAKPLRTWEEDAAEKAAIKKARQIELEEERKQKRLVRIERIQKRIDSALRRKNANALSWIWEKVNGDLAWEMKTTKEEVFKLIDRDAVWALFGLVPTNSGWKDRDADPAYKSNSEMLTKMRNYGSKDKYWP